MMVELHEISKTYEQGKIEVPALTNISLSVAEGEYLAIMGPSGSGKTTLMNIIGCLDKPTSGEYYLENEELSSQNDARLSQVRLRKIGFVFQTFHLLPRQTALENVALPLLYAGVKKRERLELAKDALERVGLGDRIDFKPTQLSGGQCQRVAIARAIVNDPKILLADEPTGALDTKSGEQIMEVFQMLNEQGVTVVMITHDRDIAAHAKRVLYIRDGRLIDENGQFLSPAAAAEEQEAPAMPIEALTETADEAPVEAEPVDEPAALRPEEALTAEISALLDQEPAVQETTETPEMQEAAEPVQETPQPVREEPEAQQKPTPAKPKHARKRTAQPVDIESIVPMIERETSTAEPVKESAPAEVQETSAPVEAEPVKAKPAKRRAKPVDIESIVPMIEQEAPTAEPVKESAPAEVQETPAPVEAEPVKEKPAKRRAKPVDIESIVPMIEREAPTAEPVKESAPAEVQETPAPVEAEPVKEKPAKRRVKPVDIESIVPMIERETPTAEPVKETAPAEVQETPAPVEAEPVKEKPAKRRAKPVDIESIVPMIEREAPTAEPVQTPAPAEVQETPAPVEAEPVKERPAKRRAKPVDIESIVPMIEREAPAPEPVKETAQAPVEAPVAAKPVKKRKAKPVEIETEQLFKPKKQSKKAKKTRDESILIEKPTAEGAPEQISFNVWQRSEEIDIEAIVPDEDSNG